jgi:hypothetical protein
MQTKTKFALACRHGLNMICTVRYSVVTYFQVFLSFPSKMVNGLAYPWLLLSTARIKMYMTYFLRIFMAINAPKTRIVIPTILPTTAPAITPSEIHHNIYLTYLRLTSLFLFQKSLEKLNTILNTDRLCTKVES